MNTKMSELCAKEVICLDTGQRLGRVADVLLQLPEGKITALIVPGPGRCMGLIEGKEDYCVPCSAVKKIGPEIILVECDPDSCRTPHGNRRKRP